MSELSANPVRVALRALTHGVYVLSMNASERDAFLIVSLAMQCSVEPPRIAFALSMNARILHALRIARGGVLSTLDVSQKSAVRRYGAPGGVRQTPVSPSRSSEGHPIPPEAAHWIAFRTFTETVVGDHVLFVADVTDAGNSGVAIAAESANDSAQHHSPVKFAPLILAESGFPYAG